MPRRTHSVRAHLDRLEARAVPAANLTVSYSAVTHTLTVVGDAGADDVTVRGDPDSQTHFTLTSSGTINGQPSPFSTPAGVKNLVFKMLGGNASVAFDPFVPIIVQGSVTFTGGTGANTVTATDLSVGKNLSVTNAAHAAGSSFVLLGNFSAGGSVMVRNAGGDSFTQIGRGEAGVSTIKGNLTVTNGSGVDTFLLSDTNVGGHVTVNNGHGSAGVAGYFNIFNAYNTAFRSVIGGNLNVSYLDGDTAAFDGLYDTELVGNATLKHGRGSFLTIIDGYATKLPVLIHGRLTISGAGANSAVFGSLGSSSGVVVEKGFTLSSGGGVAEWLGFWKCQVGGNTSIKLGDGGNTVTIDESEFGGRFSLVSGSGNDSFNVETVVGTSSATAFHKAVLADLGTGTDHFNLGSNGNGPDGGQVGVAWGTFVLMASSKNLSVGVFFFPNGGSFEFI